MAGIFSVLLPKQQASPFVADADCFQSLSVPFLDTCSWNLKGKQCTLNLKNASQISEQKGLGKLEGVKETVSQYYWGHVWQAKWNLQSIPSQVIFTSYNLHRQVGGHTSSCSCFSANRTRRVLIFFNSSAHSCYAFIVFRLTMCNWTSFLIKHKQKSRWWSCCLLLWNTSMYRARFVFHSANRKVIVVV